MERFPFRDESCPPGAFCPVEGGDDFGLGDVVALSAGGQRHLVRVQCATVEFGFEYFALEVLAGAGGWVADAELDDGVAGRVGLDAGVVGLAVELPVAVAFDFAGLVVDDRDVEWLFEARLGFLVAADVLAAGKAVAPGHPSPALALAVNDRIEDDAGFVLHRDDAAAALVEIAELDDGLECFGQ